MRESHAASLATSYSAKASSSDFGRPFFPALACETLTSMSLRQLARIGGHVKGAAARRYAWLHCLHTCLSLCGVLSGCIGTSNGREYLSADSSRYRPAGAMGLGCRQGESETSPWPGIIGDLSPVVVVCQKAR